MDATPLLVGSTGLLTRRIVSLLGSIPSASSKIEQGAWECIRPMATVREIITDLHPSELPTFSGYDGSGDDTNSLLNRVFEGLIPSVSSNSSLC